LAYKLVNGIIKGKEFQIAAWPAFKELDLVQDPADLTLVPLHKGALKAYRELGAKIYDQSQYLQKQNNIIKTCKGATPIQELLLCCGVFY